jgi:hypothetical protein
MLAAPQRYTNIQRMKEKYEEMMIAETLYHTIGRMR